MYYRPPDSLVRGISQERTLESVSISFSRDLPDPGMRPVSPALADAAAKSLQSCPTLCNPRDGSPPGSPVPGILQARTLEWVPISFSNAWKWKVKGKLLSRVQLLATPWTAAHQAPPSMGLDYLPLSHQGGQDSDSFTSNSGLTVTFWPIEYSRSITMTHQLLKLKKT